MPEQTVKHNYNASGFLLILIPVAFLAVFVSVAWPLLIGVALLFTGNNLWQSYQIHQLSQQVNPLFNQLIIEKQGAITPLELSVRANIPGNVANRYLHGKAVEFGGTSQRSSTQGVVYNFLTVNSLESVFTGINPNPTATQKLDFEAPAIPVARLVSEAIEQPVVEQALAEISAPATAKTEPEISVEIKPVAVVPPVVSEETTVELVPEANTESSQEQPIESTTTETSAELITEPVKNDITETPVKSVIEPPPEPAPSMPISSFGQALRSVFNAEHTDEAADQEEVAAELPVSSESEREVISQADLAKRLDVHASTIYKRRSDVSFAEWTRNRDPEGFAWGYSRESKEFYRLA
jgi:hypothetical protein